MPRITFFGGPMSAALVCDYQPDGALTVLGLARQHQIPIYWRCGRGTCGSCAVRLTVLGGDSRPLDNKERNVLAREEKPLQQGWRLTCGYLLSGEDLRAEW